MFEWKGGGTLVRPDVEHPAFLQPFIDMTVLPDGSLVFGPKGHGVVLWKPGENAVTEIKQPDGLLSNKVYALHLAPDGVIWAGTHSGLSRLIPIGPRRYRVDNFTVKHGLPSNTVNDVYTTPDGSVWVATAKGLFRFREKPDEAPIPAPLFEQVSVNGVPYSAAATHTLPHDSANLVVKFLSLHFRSGGDIPYRFRLLQTGGDTTWTRTHSQTVHFSNLAPGSYRFQVQAQNEEAHWSGTSTLTFAIRPPWWAIWWARTAGATALGALIFAAYRYRIGEIRKESALREEMLRLEQSALQAQMNPHFIFNCLGSIQHFILKNETDAAVLYLARFAKLVRTALNASVNGAVTLAEEVAMLDNYLALEQMRFQKTFDYTIIVDDTLDGRHILLPPLLVQPFVENAVLHGMKAIQKDGHIWVTFRQADGYLYINIRDNGPGLPQEQLESEGKISLGGQITRRRLELLRQEKSKQPLHTVGIRETGNRHRHGGHAPYPAHSKLNTQHSKLKTGNMTALIIDDEPDARGVLKHLLGRFCPHIRVCAEADSVTNGLAAIQQHRPALVFLDIDLREGNGFDILDVYPRPDFRVIFITAHHDFALKAYKYRAFHYLLKPIDPQELIAMANELEPPNGTGVEVFEQMPKSTGDGKILLPTVQGMALVAPDEISYVFADERYATMVLESGEKIFVSRTLQDIQNALPENEFFRPHQSYLVRKGAVRKLQKGDGLTLVLRDKTVIPVSRRQRDEVLHLLGIG